MDKGVPYCLLHNYIVRKDKVILNKKVITI